MSFRADTVASDVQNAAIVSKFRSSTCMAAPRRWSGAMPSRSLGCDRCPIQYGSQWTGGEDTPQDPDTHGTEGPRGLNRR
ncbi:hypothetical protein HYQ44_007057 [Verticillium longisporum]|nr:hypothetical protein HYQ44_007057 [Verticillium longisporum]